MSSILRSIAAIGFIAILSHQSSADNQIPLTQPLANDELERDNADLTCGGARDLLLHRGYRDVEVRSCFTFAYAFTVNHDGSPTRVYVDPQNGRSWHG